MIIYIWKTAGWPVIMLAAYNYKLKYYINMIKICDGNIWILIFVTRYAKSKMESVF